MIHLLLNDRRLEEKQVRLTVYTDYALRMLMYLALKEDQLATIAEIAKTGVDYASSGALTHSAPNFDIALDIEV